MTIRIRQTEDLELVQELHRLAFPTAGWEGDEGTFWIAWESGKPIGFCSAHVHPDGTVFLSRAAVMGVAQGKGIQRRMITARMRWAVAEGANQCVTFVHPDNFPSLVNLLRCGFRFYTPNSPWGDPSSLYMRFEIARYTPRRTR